MNPPRPWVSGWLGSVRRGRCPRQLPRLDSRYWMLSEQWLLKTKHQTFSITLNHPLYFNRGHIQGKRRINLVSSSCPIMSCVCLGAVNGQLPMDRHAACQKLTPALAPMASPCVNHVEVSQSSSTSCTTHLPNPSRQHCSAPGCREASNNPTSKQAPGRGVSTCRDKSCSYWQIIITH